MNGSSSGNHAAISGAFGTVAKSLAAGDAAAGSGYGNALGTVGQATSSGAVHGSTAGGAVNASGEVNRGALLGAVNGTNSGTSNGTAQGNVHTAAGSAARQNASAVQGAAFGNVMQVSPGGKMIRNPDAGGKYLYEVRPQFAKLSQWTSSDFLFDQLELDHAATHKRLGDGFYEQQLVRDQLSELTGRQPANGASDDTVYKALLTNAVSAAKEFGLRPGVTLSAEQIARLTSDIVWMETQTVQLPDGSTETVLVPKVYLAHVDGQ